MLRSTRALVAVALLAAAFCADVAQGAAFLEEQLPLRLLLSQPAALSTGDQAPVNLIAEQPLLAIFSRAVIALGSDASGDALPADKVPFTLTAPGGASSSAPSPVPGRGRWVTSYIYRWDPSMSWPTDLNAQLTWNQGLTSYDGVPLQPLNSSAPVVLSTLPLEMLLEGVESEQAAAATNGTWEPVLWEGQEPEVPPDGVMRLRFNYGVNMSQIQEAMQVVHPGNGSRVDGMSLTISECPVADFPEPLPVSSSSSPADASAPTPDPLGGPPEAEGLVTCVAVAFDPSPVANASYKLVLPKGSTYNGVSGALGSDLALAFVGLRPFQLSFLYGEDAINLSFRRLNLLLVHGLANDSNIDDLRSAISLTKLASGVVLDGYMNGGSGMGHSKGGMAAGSEGGSMGVSYDAPAGFADGGAIEEGTAAVEPEPEPEISTVSTSGEPVPDAEPSALDVTAEGDTAGRRRLHSMSMDRVSEMAGVGSKQGDSEADPLQQYRGQAEGEAVGFNLTRIDGATAQLTAALQPGSVYMIRVKDSGSLRDAFGQPLRASDGVFHMAPVPAVFSQPSVDAYSYSEYGVPSFSSSASMALVDLTDETWNGQWDVIARGGWRSDSNAYESPEKLSSWSVPASSQQQVADLITMMVLGMRPAGAVGGDEYLPDLSKILGSPETTLNAPGNASSNGAPGGPPSVASFEARSLLTGTNGSSSGGQVPVAVLGKQACCVPVYDSQGQPMQRPDQPSFLQGTDLLVSYVTLEGTTAASSAGNASGPGAEPPRIFLAWATALAGGQPAPGATVQLWNLSAEPQPLLAVEGVTDADGLARLLLPGPATPSDTRYAMVVARGGGNATQDAPAAASLVLGEVNVWSYSSVQGVAAPLLSSSLLVDRPLVRPGEALEAWGYIWAPGPNGTLASAADTLAEWDAYVRVDNGFALGQGAGQEGPMMADVPTQSQELVLPVIVDPALGTFNVTIPVPTTASPGPDTLTLLLLPKGTPLPSPSVPGQSSMSPDFPGVLLSPVDVVVADPRPPTVELVLDAPQWADPDEELVFSASLTSYVGGDVANAPLEVTWTISTKDGTTTGSPDEPVVTNADGVAEIVIPPANVTLDAEDWFPPTLEVTVTYVGPTRERLVQGVMLPLQQSALRLVMVRSIEAETPGLEFGVAVSATDLGGANVTGEPVAITLVRNGTDELVQSCEVESGMGWGNCRLSLPDGQTAFVLQACMEYNGTQGCVSQVIGKDAEAWRQEPLEQHPQVNMVVEGDSDEVSVSLDVPYEGAWLLLAWGNYLGDAHVVRQLEKSVQNFTLQPGDQCLGGCSLQAIISVPRQTSDAVNAAAISVPISVAFDPAAPHALLLPEVYIPSPTDLQQPASLSVSGANASAPGARVSNGGSSEDDDDARPPAFEPGAAVTLSIDLPAAAAGGAGADAPARVTFVVVDKAILDLAPPQDANLTEGMAPYFPLSMSVGSSSDRMLPRAGAINDVIDVALRRLQQDPWLVPAISGDLNLFPPTGADTPDEEYLRDHASFATYNFAALIGGGGGAPRAMPGMEEMVFDSAPAPAPNPTNAAGSSKISGPPAGAGGGGASKNTPSRLTSEFEATALFEIKDGLVGAATNVSFPAPTKLGTFVVRAFVVTADGRFAQLDTEFIVRSPISLVPSAPRFARVGDTFEAGALVANTGDSPMEVEVTAFASGTVALRSGENATRALTVQPGASTEVRFALGAGALGSGSLQVDARQVAGGEAADSLVVDIPVVGLQDPMFVASSFALGSVNTSETSSWTEGLDLPAAAPGSGTINITAGVGQLPAVAALADRAVQTRPEGDEEASAGWALAALTAPYVLAQYSDAGGALGSAEDAASYAETLLGFAPAGLTSQQIGLVAARWLQRGASNDGLPNVMLNAQASWLLGRLNALGGSSGAADLLDAWQTWNDTASSGLVRQATEYRKASVEEEPYPGLEEIAAVYLALGTAWPDTATFDDPAVRQDLSLDRLVNSYANLSVAGQASLMLTLAAAPEDVRTQYAGTVDKIATGLVDSMRVGGRTAYVATEPGSAAAAASMDQALVLMALLETGKAPPVLTQKLAAYLGGSTAASAGGDWIVPASGGMGDAVVMLALQEYDAVRGNTAPSIEVSVTAGPTQLMSEFFDAPTDPVVVKSFSWDQLPNGTDALTFTAEGSGEASVAVGLHYVPAAMPSGAVYRGLEVARVVQAVNATTAEPTGPALAVVPLGSQVRVSVRVTTPDALGAVAVRVLLPGGLEPVDPNIATDAAARQQCPLAPLFSSSGDGMGTSMWGMPLICPMQYVTPRVVELRYASLYPGAHESSFLAIAASAGDWQLPPANGYALGQPEVMGLSAGGSLRVCDPAVEGGAACQLQAAEGASAAPKACPGACSGANGVCNTATGTCLCSAGFAGEDCSQLSGGQV